METVDMPDRIAEMFNGKTIFITGGTGFVGKPLIEKFLRSTNVKKIYLLIRPKKGKQPHERIKDIFNNVLFRKLHEEKPNAISRCSVIFGDVTEVDLGITTSDREILKKEVDFIVHSAATTRFDDTLEYTVKMNTRGTKYMLDLAEQCDHLQLFHHVSTAYAFPQEKITMEKEYKPPADPHEVLDIIEGKKEDTLTPNIDKILKENINFYTYSKALAEALVYEKFGKLPIIISRPAVGVFSPIILLCLQRLIFMMNIIFAVTFLPQYVVANYFEYKNDYGSKQLVVSTYKDPFPGWIHNLQGPLGLFVGAGKGVIRSMYMDSHSYANLIPVDCTVSYILASCWYYLNTEKAPLIYNACVPQSEFTATWEEILDCGRKLVSTKVPFNMILWYPGGSITKNKTYNKINVLLFHLLPAVLIDTLLWIIGQKPFLYAIHKRVIKGSEMIEYYTTKAWDFDTSNLILLRKKLNDKERQTYILHSDNIDLDDYLEKAALFARRHILKETDDMLPAARRNMKIMFMIDRAVKFVFIVFVAYFLYQFLMVLLFRSGIINERI